ncbi:MAG: BatA domain-containing protein [Candidatus Zixiibacteriota bacterium]
MFNFLNPAILLAAGAAVLFPLLIHLLNRQKVKKIFFSSLLFLKSLEKTRMRSVKIKEYLLLVIRSLIILLAVAAFARPALKGGFATKVGAHARTSAVILLDNSYSMGYETKEGPVFLLAKEKSKKILNQLKEGDEVSLVLFAAQPRLVNAQPTYDFKNLIKFLDEEAMLSAERTDVGPALTTAFQILKSSKNLNCEIYLVSDMERSGWTSVHLGSAASENKKAKLYLVDVSPSEEQNLCVEEVDFGNQLIEKGKPFQVAAKIANFSSQPAVDLLTGLYLDGKRVSQADVDVEKGGRATVKFTPVVEEAGIHTGFVELTDDDLLLDNRRFFAFRIPEKTDILLIGESDRDTRYIKLALNPLNASDASKQVTCVTRGSLPGIDFGKYQAVIISNLSRLTDIELANLERFIQRGGGVWFILGDNIDPEFYSKEIIKNLLDLNVSGPLTPVKNAGGYFSLEKLDLDHPIFQVYRELGKGQLPLIRFLSIFQLPESRDAKVMARFNVGSPAILEKDHGAGKVLLLAAPVEENEGDLVVHPFFVPLINRAVEYLASDLSRLDEDILVGSNVTRELPPDLAEKGIELIGPQMKKVALQPSFQADKLILKIEDTSWPGVYNISAKGSTPSAGDEIVDRFAVNIDPKDSDPQRIDKSELEGKMEGLRYTYVNPQDDVEKSILQSRYGKELWKTFLWIAVGLLALEMFLARSRKKDTITEEKT